MRGNAVACARQRVREDELDGFDIWVKRTPNVTHVARVHGRLTAC